MKGFQDSKGAALPNAHLLGIYHRVCKLLYFRIKPVFVFDGGVPVLKKNTIVSLNKWLSLTNITSLSRNVAKSGGNIDERPVAGRLDYFTNKSINFIGHDHEYRLF